MDPSSRLSWTMTTSIPSRRTLRTLFATTVSISILTGFFVIAIVRIYNSRGFPAFGISCICCCSSGSALSLWRWGGYGASFRIEFVDSKLHPIAARQDNIPFELWSFSDRVVIRLRCWSSSSACRLKSMHQYPLLLLRQIIQVKKKPCTSDRSVSRDWPCQSIIIMCLPMIGHIIYVVFRDPTQSWGTCHIHRCTSLSLSLTHTCTYTFLGWTILDKHSRYDSLLVCL